MGPKLLRTAAGGLLVALVLLGLLEAGLGLVPGLDPGRRTFDPRAAYLVPEPGVAGAWRTTYWQGVRDELVLPPKRRRKRVLVFGGSNAWGFREETLRRGLERACGRRAFEVQNLGRNGYGSERVLYVFEQALEHLDPDVVVLYLGDNEFVEPAVPTWLRRVPAALRGLRAARLIARWLDRVRAGPRLPEPWVADWDFYHRYAYADTQRRLEDLRANVRAMGRLASERGVHVVISTVVYNRFAAPWSSHLADARGDARERVERHLAAAALDLPELLRPLLPASQAERVRRMDWDDGGGVPPEEAARLRAGLRTCGGLLAGVDPLPPDPAHWSAGAAALLRCLGRFHARRIDDGEREGLRRAADELDRALAVVPDHPRALFERGLTGYLLGEDDARVERLLLDAARYDRAPKKSSEAINDILRSVAAELPDALLFDADELVASASPGRLTGWEYLYDHCHLLPGGAAALMDACGAAIVARWYPPDRPGLGR
jgi:hypothetical protein